jgi:drug/metabolite transporter superfamily protein YnfA
MFVLIPAAILIIGAWVIWRRIQDKKSGFPAQDERTQKVNGKAATYALYIGSYFMIALLFGLIIGKEIFDLPPFDAGDALVASLLVFNLAFLGLRWYFNRKGDF